MPSSYTGTALLKDLGDWPSPCPIPLLSLLLRPVYLQLRLRYSDVRLLDGIAILLGRAGILKQARGLGVSPLLPGKARRLEDGTDFFKSVTSSLDKEIPNGQELERFVSTSKEDGLGRADSTSRKV